MGLWANGYSFHDVHALVGNVSRDYDGFFNEGFLSMRQPDLCRNGPRVNWPCATA